MRKLIVGLFSLIAVLPSLADDSLAMSSADVQRFMLTTQALQPQIEAFRKAQDALESTSNSSSEHTIEDYSEENYAETFRNSFSLQTQVDNFQQVVEYLPASEHHRFISAINRHGYTSDESYAWHLAIATDVLISFEMNKLDSNDPRSALGAALASAMVSKDIPESTFAAFSPYRDELASLFKNTWYTNTGTGE